MQSGERFFRGKICEPEGSGERVVVGKATKALAERMAVKDAEKVNWDWIVEHCQVNGDGDDQEVVVIEQWSSVGGHEVFQLP